MNLWVLESVRLLPSSFGSYPPLTKSPPPLSLRFRPGKIRDLVLKVDHVTEQMHAARFPRLDRATRGEVKLNLVAALLG